VYSQQKLKNWDGIGQTTVGLIIRTRSIDPYNFIYINLIKSIYKILKHVSNEKYCSLHGFER
jgi:hypothetical protein